MGVFFVGVFFAIALRAAIRASEAPDHRGGRGCYPSSKRTLDLSNEKLCELFAHMGLEAQYYLSLGCVDRLLGDEKRYVNLGHYLLEEKYFFNEFHEEVFKAAYPKLHSFLFLGGKLVPKALTDLSSMMSNTVKALPPTNKQKLD